MNGKERRQSKINARLALVQAIYENDATDINPADIKASFLSGAMGGEVLQETETEEKFVKIFDFDKDFFCSIFDYAVENGKEIDDTISSNLDGRGWTMEKLEAVLKAILKAGIAELCVNIDTDRPIIISEYIDMTDSFYPDGTEKKLVNAVLDKVAKTINT